MFSKNQNILYTCEQDDIINEKLRHQDKSQFQNKHFEGFISNVCEFWKVMFKLFRAWKIEYDEKLV